MSKERLDIAIGILDNTENEIERIKNQQKFEKDLSEFLNTNTYSKDKYWVVGMLNQVSEYCKDKIDILMENQQTIELQKQLLDTQEENQKLKDRWQKLQDDLMLFYTVGSTSDSYGHDVYKSIFDRMKEPEKEKNNGVRNS